ncbi:SPT3 Dosage dependent suppressor of Ty-induced promoter mutations-like protein [Gamsiella multidivaricata]|nr:SPT3 Dosage dependent suppressor of Ty-induced promoter mutations-like protein [Gamsiella multidivaricata]
MQTRRPCFNKPATTHRLNVKTHVFKKELQEYVPTQIEDRLRIETIIYVELSIVDQNNALVNAYDYARLPKDLFFSQPDKVMSPEEMGTKRIVDISATLQCPSNGWQEEKEACLRCARRMSTKLDQTETRIMHMLPELHRTDNGDALISFRSGVANIQFKINCYCGHKKEKEGFVIRFDSQSDVSIASHVTLPLMFYHQNKNRVASRALAAAAKAQAKSGQQQPEQGSATRNIVKSVTSKTKRESRSKPGHSPTGNQQHHIPSPPSSLLDSPIEWSSSPEMEDFIDSSDIPFTVPSPPPPDPLISLFPESAAQEQQQAQQPTIALISHMTPNSGSVRGGTLVTIHGTGFTVGEVMYVCFGENMVPIIPQRDHMLELITPAANKAETVPVFAMNPVESIVAQATFTYVDDNEKELIKLALQRMMSISARMEGPLDNVLSRANEFALWNDLLEGGVDSSSVSSQSYTNLEKMVLESFKILDTPTIKNFESLSIANATGHTMLHLAVWLQLEALATDLLARHIETTVQDKNGLTALDWAHRLNNQAMVDLLLGSVVSAPVSVVAGGKLALTAECDEAAHGFRSSVSPGSRPTATDQPNVDPGHGGVTDQAVIPLSHPVGKDLTLDLGHDGPHMDVEWEGFGQGPGKDVVVQGGVVDGFFETQHDQDFFMQQARKDSSGLLGEMVVDHDGQRLVIHQQQPQRDSSPYLKTWSAIPAIASSSDESAALAPVQDAHSPTPHCYIPLGDDRVGQAGIIADSVEMRIPLENLATATCPIGGLSTIRLPVGGLDHIAPEGQGVVAMQGCTGRTSVAPVDVVLSSRTENAGQDMLGVQGSGSIQRIQGTARIDGHVQEARAPTVVVGEVGPLPHQHQAQPSRQLYSIEHAVQHFEQVQSENPVLTAQESEVVVRAEEVAVVEADSSEGGSHNSAAEQAVVQSSRNDVESEPLLFLGGLPVTLSPRPVRTVASRNGSNDATQQQQQQQGSSGSEDEVDNSVKH